jgi:hypothetical protein
MLMAAIFDPPPFKATGGSLAVPGAAGNADVEDMPAAWAIAIAEVKTTAAAREYTNLSFMGFTLTPWGTAFF